MYKLLLAANDPAVIAAFDAVSDWNLMGFQKPRIVSNAEEAMESLEKHHADGIAMALSEADEKLLTAYLTERYPLLPILPAGSDVCFLYENLQYLQRLIGQMNADHSNDRYSPDENMRRIRHAYFRTLLSGQINSAESMRARLRMLRSRMNPDVPCMLVRFSLPADDGYLAGRWHYGNERLEIAMRNIFGPELHHMRLLVSVLEDGRIYLLACPMVGMSAPEGNSMSEIVTTHAEGAIKHVANYLGIDMSIDSVNVLKSVTMLAQDDFRRSLGIG